MSGGVDSSVAAALLKEQGVRVLGVTFRLFGCDVARSASGSCCSQTDVADAMRVANSLGIEHFVVDFSAPFKRHVIDPFVEAYRSGRTPNPCILCNQHIKFGALFSFAESKGASQVATGHYARTEAGECRYRLLKGVDQHKDQSYFVFPIRAEMLGRVVFPVGSLRKAEVRAAAARHGLPVADKRESQEICFSGGGSYVGFLERLGGARPTPGDVVLPDGTVLGRHVGLHRYTVGQRKGLGIGHSEPLYVIAKEVDTNRLVVGPKAALGCIAVDCRRPVWPCGAAPAAGETVSARIRYRSRETEAVVEVSGDDGFRVRFAQPVDGVAPGQAAVLYRGEEVLGGGWIVAATPA